MDEFTIDQVYYTNPKHVSVLEAVLTQWFKNPKDLQFTDPRMTYPFSFNRWRKLSYEQPFVDTYVLKNGKWIIGYVSVMSIPNHKQKHIFHFFIEKGNRGKGLGKWFLDHLLEKIHTADLALVTLRVLPKNEIAIKLYESRGFLFTGKTHSGSLNMEKRYKV